MPDYSRIKLIVLDVDGTMTDGGIYYDDQGNELKRFNVKDGLAIRAGVSAGFEFLILTGRKSSIVERRAKELGIQHIITGVQLKYPALKKWLDDHSVSWKEVCYIGDDWNDMQCMKATGVSMCPKDAIQEIIEISNYVSDFIAGYGAVRDCIETLLREQHSWEEACEREYFA